MLTAKRADAVLRRLITEILQNKKGMEGRLPSAKEMAEEYGISTASVREALKTLETIGIVTISHGKGIFVQDGTTIIRELLEARELIECHSVVQAAESATEAEVDRLYTILEAMQNSLEISDVDGYSRLDHQFHLLITALSQNRILAKVLDTMKLLLFYQQIEANRVPRLLQTSNQYHKDIARAIADHDPDTARQSMQKHLHSLVVYWDNHIKGRAIEPGSQSASS